MSNLSERDDLVVVRAEGKAPIFQESGWARHNRMMRHDDRVWLAFIAAYTAPLLALGLAVLRRWCQGLAVGRPTDPIRRIVR